MVTTKEPEIHTQEVRVQHTGIHLVALILRTVLHVSSAPKGFSKQQHAARAPTGTIVSNSDLTNHNPAQVSLHVTDSDDIAVAVDITLRAEERVSSSRVRTTIDCLLT